MKSHQLKLLFISIVFLFQIITLVNNASAGIGLGATSGLINIPTAEVSNDEQITISFNTISRHSAYIKRDSCDNYLVYFAIGFLPRLELSASLVIIPGFKSYDGTNVYKDAVYSFQFLVINERKFFPSLAIGIRDIYSFILLNTSYLTASKTIFENMNVKFRIHGGYGSDLIDRHIGVPEKDQIFPVGHTIIGGFGGFDFTWKNKFTSFLEYDSDKFNCGVRYQLVRSLNIDIDLLNMKNLSGGINYSFSL